MLYLVIHAVSLVKHNKEQMESGKEERNKLRYM